MTNYSYSRLQRNYDKKGKRKIVLFVVGSILSLIILMVYGVPLLFGLTGTISNLRHGSTKTVIKTVPPSTPVFSQNFTATPSSTIKIVGAADPNTTIEIFQNTRSTGTVVSQENGSFAQEVDLEKGTNIFTAQAINEAGQKSEISTSYSVNLLTGKPKLEIDTLKDGDSVKNTPITISGLTDAGDSITVNDRLAIVGNDGKFNFSIELNEGDNKLRITSTDPANNSTTKELTVKYQK